MSFALPSVDLTGKIAGNTGVIALQNMGISAGGVSAHPAARDNKATIYFFNDSGCGLLLECKTSGDSINLPAGAWMPVAVSPGEAAIKWTILYALPNPPVSTLLLTWYAPGEIVPQTSTLGNSPIGGGTSVSGQILSNEINAANFETIDIGVVGNTKLIDIFNDHFIWSVLQSGIVHQVLKGQSVGTPLQIGQAGDITDILGGINLVGKATTIAGGVSGSVTLYELLVGTPKLSIVNLKALKTGVSFQHLPFTYPYTNKAGILVLGDIPSLTQFFSVGVAANIQVLNSTAITGGSSAVQNNIDAFTFGMIQTAFDDMGFPANNSTTHSALVLLIGE